MNLHENPEGEAGTAPREGLHQMRRVSMFLPISFVVLLAANGLLVWRNHSLIALNSQLLTATEELRAVASQLLTTDGKLKAANDELIAADERLKAACLGAGRAIR